MAKGEEASRRAAARRENNAKKAAKEIQQGKRAFPEGHQRDGKGRTKG